MEKIVHSSPIRSDTPNMNIKVAGISFDCCYRIIPITCIIHTSFQIRLSYSNAQCPKMKFPITKFFELYRQRTTLEYNLSLPSVPPILCFTFNFFYGKSFVPDCGYPDYILGDWFSWIPCRWHYPYSVSNSRDCYHLEVNQKRLMAWSMSLAVYLELGFLLKAQI